MNIKLTIKKQVKIKTDVFEEKVNRYLEKKFYRVVDRGIGFIVFTEDEYSNRKRLRSDAHTRVGEGKFEFHSNEDGTAIKLIYLTNITYPIILMTVFTAIGIYYGTFLPGLTSVVFTLPIVLRIFYLKEHTIDDILEQ